MICIKTNINIICVKRKEKHSFFFWGSFLEFSHALSKLKFTAHTHKMYIYFCTLQIIIRFFLITRFFKSWHTGFVVGWGKKITMMVSKTKKKKLRRERLKRNTLKYFVTFFCSHLVQGTILSYLTLLHSWPSSDLFSVRQSEKFVQTQIRQEVKDKALRLEKKNCLYFWMQWSCI